GGAAERGGARERRADRDDAQLAVTIAERPLHEHRGGVGGGEGGNDERGGRHGGAELGGEPRQHGLDAAKRNARVEGREREERDRLAAGARRARAQAARSSSARRRAGSGGGRAAGRRVPARI